MAQPEPMDIANYRITHGDVEWNIEDGRVAVRKRKFGNFGSRMLRLFRVNPVLTVRLDALGTAAWQLMDGRTVAALLDSIQEQFPDEEQLMERFTTYLSRLVANKLVVLQPPA